MVIRYIQCGKNTSIPFFCLLSLQRKLHLLSDTVGLLSSPSNTPNLQHYMQILHPYMCKDRSSIYKSKCKIQSRDPVTIIHESISNMYHYTTNGRLILKQIVCN